MFNGKAVVLLGSHCGDVRVILVSSIADIDYNIIYNLFR
jgi:hypothetical protein